MNNCDSPGLMPIKQALEKILQQAHTITDIQTLNLLEAKERVLAHSITSLIDVPPHDNSAMDGYAIRVADVAINPQLELVGTSLAGEPFKGELKSGQCVRIMTGAVIPKGADAVVMQENTAVDGPNVRINQLCNVGNNIRKAGEDIQKSDVVVEKGTRLSPAHLSLIASVGIANVSVIRKPRIALIATGDELTRPGEPLKQGAIYESNRYALIGMLENAGAKVIDFGIVKDEINQLTDVFTQAQQEADLIISSGGVSVGDADFVKDIITEMGQVDFWKVAIKPGKPFAFGKLAKTLFCGLPGNPVSSYVTFQQLVLPLIKHLTGQPAFAVQTLTAMVAETLYKRPGRADYQRGHYYYQDNGQLMVRALGKQGSGIMSSICHANCYIMLDIESKNVDSGSLVSIQPFDFIK